MKKLVVLLALGLGAILITMIGTSSVQGGPARFDSLLGKCYQARLAKRSPTFHQQTLPTLDDNFGVESETTLLRLSLFCNQMEQEHEVNSDNVSAGTEPEDIKGTCYDIRETNQHDPENIFVQTKLGELVLTVGKAQAICVPAFKGSGDLPPIFDKLEGFIVKCYSARTAKGTPRFSPTRVGLSDQFGEKLATIVRPVAFCNFGFKASVKCFKTKCPNGDELPNEPDSIVCYSLRQSGFRPQIIPILDQFLDQQFVDPMLSVRKPVEICLPSAKKANAEHDLVTNASNVYLSCLKGNFLCDYEDHVGTLNATKSRNDPLITHCESVDDGFSYGHSVWYTYTPGATNVTIDTEDSTYDTVLVVYTGTKEHLTQVACSDDGGPDQTSFLKLELTPGTKYTILVGSFGSDHAGKLKFRVFDQDSDFCGGGTGSGSAAGPCPTAQGGQVH